MSMRHLASLLTLVLIGSCPGQAQVSPSAGPVKADYSQESAVIEKMTTKVVFDNSGTYTRDQTTRVRVQSDAGVKQWGLLTFPFQSATERVEIEFVRVRKPDGSIIVTPEENEQDLDAEITRAAPFYSDLREKHVAVKGLGNGDILEYAAHWRASKPVIPGQFWFQYNFVSDGIVLDERLEIQVPAERAVKAKGPQERQSISAQGGSRVYQWSHSRLSNTKEAGADEKKLLDAALGRLPPPDVQISSFQSWDEVGEWYWNLQKERVAPTAAIRAKAAEITKGLTDDAARMQALYNFVSTQYRYIGIAFGIGRYQPHAAEDVLNNSYGDCKDKHTLLASLLQASGVTIYPVLINAGRKLDPDIPSPAQFDHLIGYLPQGKDPVWLDTTPEVAPIDFLLPPLRDKQALVLLGEKSAQLMTTPADPPFPSTQTFKIEGKLGDDGALEAKVEDTMQGENAILLRAAFRQVPQPQWKDLVQQISYGLGFVGTVSEVSASSPQAIGEPFHFSYSYHRKDYPDWSNHQFTMPGLPFGMPPARDDAKYPVWLGSPIETASNSKVEVPKGYEPVLPANVDLKYDFAEYHASYSRVPGGMIAKRRMVIKQHEVPVAKLDDYRSFLKNMQNDLNQYVQTLSDSADQSSQNVMASMSAKLRDLPNSPSGEANRLESEGRDELRKNDLKAAVSSLRGAVAADAKFARAWVALGMVLVVQHKADEGIDAFHKAMALEPAEPAIEKMLGYYLMAAWMYEPAIPVWQAYLKAHPDDVDGYANLAACLRDRKRYAEAAEAYESAVKLKSDRPNLQLGLASTYLKAGDKEKAAALLTKLDKVDTKGIYLNNIAYEMASADFELPLALNFAKKAVRSAEEESQLITLADLKIENVKQIFDLASYWDTLGWVQERMSNMEAAERYLLASWKATQNGVVAGHLCHLYRRLHRTGEAAQMCRMAISRMSMSNLTTDEYATEMEAAEENLKHLSGSAAASKGAGDGSNLVIQQRTFKLPRFLPGSESAEFFVLLASDGKSKRFQVEDVKFISGSEKMKLQERQLKSIDFKVPAPSENPARFVWRGILGCYQYTGCSFVVLDPASVQTVN